MRVFLIFLVAAAFLAGCNARPSVEQANAVRNQDVVLMEQARLKRISWTAAVRESNSNAAAIDPRMSTPEGQTGLAYRLALAAEVDAGRSTPEQFDFVWKKYVSDMSERDTLRRQIAIQNFSNALISTGAALQAASPAPPARLFVTCDSSRLGQSIQTTCQ